MDGIIAHALKTADDQGDIKQVKRVAGGSINESYFVETDNRRYFLKHHANPPERFFELEAKGLAKIRETNTIAVPEVVAYDDTANQAFLLMEWVAGQKAADTESQLGEQIAALHQTFGEAHGFTDDTFIGILPQPNGLFSSWLEYYRDQRLKAQLEMGIQQGSITGKRRERLETLLDRLGEWVPGNVEASYLHGDLWGGNWLSGPNGVPYVIDPSFLYGDRRFELAFTELFGGYSQAFYQAYQAGFPVSKDYEDVKPLYQLYYLLVHLNLFGEAYGAEVDAIIRRYTGK